MALIIKTFFYWILESLAFWSRDSSKTNSLIDAIRIGAGLLSDKIIPLFVLLSGLFNPIFWTQLPILCMCRFRSILVNIQRLKHCTSSWVELLRVLYFTSWPKLYFELD